MIYNDNIYYCVRQCIIKNKYCNYTLSYIITIFILHYIREYKMQQTFLLYMKVYIVLYDMLYNNNKHFMIHENVSLIIRHDV